MIILTPPTKMSTRNPYKQGTYASTPHGHGIPYGYMYSVRQQQAAPQPSSFLQRQGIYPNSTNPFKTRSIGPYAYAYAR